MNVRTFMMWKYKLHLNISMYVCIYRCTVKQTFKGRYILFSHTFHCRCIYVAPQIVLHPTDTSAAAPFSGLFSCSVQAYGYPTSTWYRNDKNPVPKKAYSTLIPLVNMTTSILTIPNVTIEDIGTYYCVVWAKNRAVKSQAGNLIFAGSTTFVLCVCNM